MAELVSIPANRIVNVVPSAIQAGNSNFVLNGAILSPRALVPVKSYSSASEVAKDYGELDSLTVLATTYFAGVEGATKLPERLIIAQLITTPQPVSLVGGSVRNMSLSDLQQIRGSLAIYVDGETKTGNFDFSKVTSFTQVAEILSGELGVDVNFNEASQSFIIYGSSENGGGLVDGDIQV